MGYENFKATIWSKHIQTQIPQFTVFKNDCDYTFEGEAKLGAKLKIIGVGRPSVGTYVPGTNINDPETVQDGSQYLEINQYKYFNYQVDDVDQAQTSGILPVLSKESTRALAEEEDKFIAEDCAKNAKHKYTPGSAITTADGAIGVIDTLFEKLWEEGVSSKDDTTIYVNPWFYNLIKSKLISWHTENDKIIYTGLVGSYNGAKVKMTNNIYHDGTNYNIIVKTSKGYAFANGINKVQAYRPEKLFSDAVKGLDTFGGKAVRPEQIAVGCVHKS